ncbi:MAG TPA: 50S ribosomal protein L11 methyltransferase, partial [Thermoflexales bacterium]|nr:50S ribosomal protein L11 methyltransferase [Thermoflexales bacterium]
MNYIELCIETDPELAEAISEAIYPHVEGGVALEQVRDWPMETEWKADADGWMVDAEGARQSLINDPDNPVKVLVRGYLPQDETLETRRAAVEQALGYLNMIRPIPMPTYKEIKQEDWAEAWKVSFKPLRIGKRILIRPTWVELADLDVKTDDIVLALDP